MKQKFVVRLMAGVLALVILLGLLLMPVLATENPLTLHLHYNRPDGN